MSAIPNNPNQGVLDEITSRAIEARDHLVAAIEGLDRIIALATQQGREDIVEEAKKQRIAAIHATNTFNDEIADRDVDDLNPDTVNALHQQGKQSEQDMRALYAELEKRVSGLEGRVDEHGGRLDAIEAVLPKDDNGKLMNVSTFIDNRINAALEGTRQFVNDVAGREVWAERPLRVKGAFVAFLVTVIAFTGFRWVFVTGFWAALGWFPGFVIAGIIGVVVLLAQNFSKSNNSNTAPAVREEGH